MLFKIRALLVAALMIVGISLLSGTSANASTVQASSPAPSKAMSLEQPSPSGTEGTDTTAGPWWPEVNVYVGCNNTWSYSGAAWDLQGGAWYTTSWDYTYSSNGGSGGAWDQNRETRQASSTGFLTTSTFYGFTSDYYYFSATMRLYKDGQEVGQHTTSCGK